MTLSRRQFLGTCAAGCALAACGGPHIDGSVTPANGQATLTFAQFPTLAMAGGGVIVDVAGRDPIAVIRTSDTTVAALDAVCTHEGCMLGFDKTQLSCDCHGSTFSFDGAVTHGPASRPLRHFNATLGADAVVVAVG
jgi:cytochrome b6-f complex iron-sulfur subunit